MSDKSKYPEAFSPKELYALSIDRIFDLLETSKKGIATNEAESRLSFYGRNEIKELKKKPLILKFLANFYHLFAILLWVGGILALIGGLPELGYAIFAVIVINAIFSFLQEFRAEKATEALKQLLPSYAKTIREGELKKILANELVPGDILVIEEGDHISADARLIEDFELKVNNATLTGESAPVRKNSDTFLEEMDVTSVPNLIFAGTSVSAGSGKAVIYATGMRTEFGKIANLTQAVEEELSPLQKQMVTVTQLVAAIAIGLGIVFFILGSVRGMPFIDRFLFAVGIIVANVPEGLLPTITLSLAMGVQRMSKRHALIKKLSAVETLGSTSVICTDKTGTLTQNEMTVREIYANGKVYRLTGVGYEPQGGIILNGNLMPKTDIDNELRDLIVSMSLCNSAKMVPPKEKHRWGILGDPTEGALLVAAEKCDYPVEQTIKAHHKIYLLPFDSTRKRMSTINADNGRKVAYTKGAPKETIALCNKVKIDNEVRELTEDMANEFIKANDDFAKSGLRVLAIARRELPSGFNDYSIETVEKDLTLLGLTAMMDPPRPEVQAAVEMCFSAGIKIIMITGDYGLTAESIARKIGIVKGKDVTIVTGAELEKIDETTLAEIVAKQNVIFARVSPEHKMKIVEALKDNGETVAVTGDGVNDAPALKRADIGVAMGITGTDVAKEAADMILTDDNFASIVNAIEEGRAVYDNIRKFITYIFASNIPEIIPFILFVLLRIPLPLTVLQILAVDLGTDMLPALALGTEKPEPGVMNRPPRPRKERLLNFRILSRAYFFLGPIEAFAAMAGFFFIYSLAGYGLSQVVGLPSSGVLYQTATTMTLAAIVVIQIGNGFACRTERASIFSVGFFSNRLLLIGIIVELILIFILVYVKPFQEIFGLRPLTTTDWLFLFIFTPVILFADEIRKFIARRVWKEKIYTAAT